MRSILLIIFLYPIILFSQEPPLYKGLIYKMPINDAKKEFRKNKDEYKTISLGNGVDWKMYAMNFAVNQNNELVGLNLNSGSMFGDSPETTDLFIRQTRNFFEELGYTVVYEPEYWDTAVLFSEQNKYGLLLHNPEKTIMVSLRPVPHPTERLNYVPVMGISNFQAFVDYMEADDAAVKKAREKTGF